MTIFGKIRVGKTSNASTLIHICTILFQQSLTELIHKTKVLFKTIDFNILDDAIFSLFAETDFEQINFEDVTSKIIDWFQIDSKGHYFDFIKDRNVHELIYDYVVGVYVLYVRNNYVMANIPIYNRITGNYSFLLETRWLEVKNAYDKKDFGIDDYMVLFIDEITDDKGASTWTQDAKDESGYKEYLRKFGQYHQERNRLISTKQDALDEVKKNRNLTQSNIHMTSKVQTIHTFRSIYQIIKLSFAVKLFMYKTWIHLKFLWKVTRKPKMIKGFKSHLALFLDKQFSRINYERNVMNRLFFWDQFLFSFGYNVYQMKNYADVDDVGKKDEGDEFVLIAPVIYGFGTYETHLAKHDFKQLKERSTTVINESNPYDIKGRFDSEERGVTDDLIAL